MNNICKPQRELVLATLFACALHSPGAAAEEATTRLQSTVTGNQEQPRVMYIVPWQQPSAAQFDYQLENHIAEDLFTTVDRDEFLRAMAYRKLLSNGVGDRVIATPPGGAGSAQP